jgi:hypothetical protein
MDPANLVAMLDEVFLCFDAALQIMSAPLGSWVQSTLIVVSASLTRASDRP